MSGCCGGKAAEAVLGSMEAKVSDAEREALASLWRTVDEAGELRATAYVPVAEHVWLEVPDVPTSADRIKAEYRRLCDMALEKNAAYGDSALHPINVFSKLNGPEGIRARLDDKLARHKNAPGALGEREIDDLIGYLVLLNIAERNAEKERGE